MAKTVLVTGASGRMGRYIAKALIDKGYKVRSLVQNRDHILTLPAGTVPYLGDIGNPKTVNKACDGADAVIHLAGVVSEYKFTTEEILKANVVGTRNVLDACKDNGVKKMIFSSSVDVYGRVRKERLSESSSPKPTDKYGYSKMLAEGVIKEEAGQVNCTIFRLATAYGPGFEHSFFKVLRLIKQGKAYMVGTGENHLALIHVSDVARGFILALTERSASNMVFNLTDGGEYTQKYLFELTAQLLDAPKPTKQISSLVMNVMAKTRNIDSDELRFLTSNRIIDISLAKKELGFRPLMGIKDGARELVKEFLEKQVYAEMRSAL